MRARKHDTMNEKHIFLNGDRQTDAQGEAEILQIILENEYKNSTAKAGCVVSRVQKCKNGFQK